MNKENLVPEISVFSHVKAIGKVESHF